MTQGSAFRGEKGLNFIFDYRIFEIVESNRGFSGLHYYNTVNFKNHVIRAN